MTRPVLIVGAPRSGTTWVAQALAAGGHAAYLEEPDNHLRFAYALRAKSRLGLGAYPLLGAADEPAGGRDHAALWAAALSPAAPSALASTRRRLADRLVRLAGEAAADEALAGSPGVLLRVASHVAAPERSTAVERPLIVKSVFAGLCVEWIAAAHDVEVVIVLRDPLSVASSWVTMGWLDGPEPLEGIPATVVDVLAERYGAPPRAGALARATWLTGVLTCALDESLARHSTWHRAHHGELCSSPSGAFAELGRAVGLGWSADGDALLRSSDRPGTGYETQRVAADLDQVWRRRLDDAQAEEVIAALAPLPLPAWVTLPR